MVITNGHHAPCHRNNNIHQTAGAPYPSRKKTRPQSIHGPPSTPSTAGIVKSPNLQYAQDDINLDLPIKGEFLNDASRSISEENLVSSNYADWSFDPVSSSQTFSASDNRGSLDFSNLDSSLSMSWHDMSPARTESVFPILPVLGTSPNFDYPAFQPSDLPLVSPDAATFSATFTLDDSSYAMAPGLTSTSSARSENDIWADASNVDSNGYWQDTIQIRNNSSSGLDQYNDISVNMAPSSSAMYNESKNSVSQYGVSATAYDMSNDEIWLGNMGTEPPGSSTDLSAYFASDQSYSLS
jgi:hypothetical protein